MLLSKNNAFLRTKWAGCLIFLVFIAVVKPNGMVWAQSSEDLEWYQKVKVNADLRLRHESIFQNGGTGAEDQNRQRIRFRIGAKLNISKGLDIGFRLATDGMPGIGNFVTSTGWWKPMRCWT